MKDYPAVGRVFTIRSDSGPIGQGIGMHCKEGTCRPAHDLLILTSARSLILPGEPLALVCQENARGFVPLHGCKR